MTTMTNQPLTSLKTDSLDNQLPSKPAIDIALQGQYLIEASAGTGKTWTLTGVVLRLIVEAGYPCEKIIATTFTRSAAAEMRQRIRERLQNFYQLLQVINHDTFYQQHLQQHYANPPATDAIGATDTADTAQTAQTRYTQFLTAFETRLNQLNLADVFADDINKHLIQYFAKQVFGLQDDRADNIKKKNNEQNQTDINDDTHGKTETNPSQHRPLDFRIALQRTTLALNQLDKLFVSTLDSLCQKWLREFSSETGFSADVQISNDTQGIILGMIHDQLRAFWAHIHDIEPEIYALMLSQNKLSAAKDYVNVVEKALNFYTAPIDEITIEPLDLSTLHQTVNNILNFKDESFEAYYDVSFRQAQNMTKNGGLFKHFDSFPKLQQQLQDFHIAKLFELDPNMIDFLTAVQAFYETQKGFNKDSQAAIAKLQSFSVIKALHDLAVMRHAIVSHIDGLNHYFTQFIARYVREQLPQVLEAQRLTTFSLQLARLNRALEGKQGEALARYIRYQYPVALIDESQDINTEQAILIKRIYLDNLDSQSKDANPEKTHKGFLLLVGDPKQAIYGFRGGDVQNYNTLKRLFKEKPLALTTNRRSSKALIDSLNAWYGVKNTDHPKTNEDATKADQDNDWKKLTNFLGTDIYYTYIDAAREHAELVSEQDSKLSMPSTPLPTFYQLHIPYKTPLPAANASQTNSADPDNDNDSSNDHEEFIEASDAIVAEIFALFEQGLVFQKPLDDDKKDKDNKKQSRALSLSDICVLATRHKDLDTIEKVLHQRGIATIRGGNQSVFSDVMAQDLLALMLALLSPYQKSKVKSLLMSKFFQLSLQQTNDLFETQPHPAHENTAEPLDNATQNSVATALPQAIERQKLANHLQEALVYAGERWQKEGFLVAMQWWLNQAFQVGDETTQLSFWQRLARDRAGERLLIDLRQLIDILAERFSHQQGGQGAGEYQLVEWYQNQFQSEPKDEWAIQQRLPSEQGVQLMTIHQSKGLEFAIVFVVGLSEQINTRRDAHHLYLYSPANSRANSLLNRRLSPIEASQTFNFKTIENDSLYQERLRLMYVALTRARERLYLITTGKDKNYSNIPLTAFMQDCKNFVLNESLVNRVAVKDVNSLSKFFNNNQKLQTKKGNESQNSTDIGYHEHLTAIKNLAFIGWSNTSFTALSRLIYTDKLDNAIHEADYDEIDNLIEEYNEASRFVVENIAPISPIPPIKATEAPIAPIDVIDHNEPLQPQAMENWQPYDIDPTMADYPNYLDEVNEWHDLSDFEPVDFTIENLDTDLINDDSISFNSNNRDNFAEDSLPPNWHQELSTLTLVADEDFSYIAPDKMPVVFEEFEPNLNFDLLPSEAVQKQLLRFNFEKGTSAGVFLHKVLEDLANSFMDEDTINQTQGMWQPPKRWAVMIDRALRKQQLPNHYYSTMAASEGLIGQPDNNLGEDATKNSLQPQYLALSFWLNEVIHTPLLASNQRPVDIKLNQKIAEMAFNMRLNNELSLMSINQLFADYGMTLNLQEQTQKNSVWQYLKGEIDLVYQYDNKFYLVDYKSNYLGNTFDDYAPDRLNKAMDEHGYWLQASIYQVALHRYLQLRLPNYDIHTHLGAVEYAFIRGMSPYAPTQGRLVWQPPTDFILELDKRFG